MTQQELAGQLGRLDPGAVFTMDESALAKAFDARSIDYETLSKIEELAMKYGCSFSCHDRGNGKHQHTLVCPPNVHSRARTPRKLRRIQRRCVCGAACSPT
jgi:hypothetical protein